MFFFQILSVEEEELEIDFMHPSGETWIWPSRKDRLCVLRSECNEVAPPTPAICSTARKCRYKFD